MVGFGGRATDDLGDTERTQTALVSAPAQKKYVAALRASGRIRAGGPLSRDICVARISIRPAPLKTN
jgi:hypothetical protein